MLLNFIWDLYLCFCFPFVYVSLARSVRRWCFLWQTALVWKALWNACRYGASWVSSRVVDFTNPSHSPSECCKLMDMLLTSWVSSASQMRLVHVLFIVELMPLKLFQVVIFKSSRLHDSFSVKRFVKGEMLLLCVYEERNNLTAQHYMSGDCFLTGKKKSSRRASLVILFSLWYIDGGNLGSGRLSWLQGGGGRCMVSSMNCKLVCNTVVI